MRKYVLVYNIEDQGYRIGFRDQFDAVDTFYIETTIPLIKTRDMAEKMRDALTLLSGD